MTPLEKARRVTAWTWAAETLGQEVTPERLEGLVDVTASVRVDNLRPAIEAALKVEAKGFLPSPGAVITCANRIAERRSSELQLERGQDMSSDANREWHEEHNPEGWATEKWRGFSDRMGTDTAYRNRVYELNARRHRWAEAQVREDIGGRAVSIGERHRMRLAMNRIARARYPNPDPSTGEYEGAPLYELPPPPRRVRELKGGRMVTRWR